MSVAAYPEKHPEVGSLEADIEHLKETLDAGASKAICGFVLDAAAYGRFLEQCDRHGVDAPIVPGLMPLGSWTRLRRLATANVASIPVWRDRLFSQAAALTELMPYLSAASTIEQPRRLIACGAPAAHVYTMNRWAPPLALAKMLGH